MRKGFSRAALAGVAVLWAAGAALADDSGVHAFLSNLFGEAGRSSYAQPTVRVARPERMAVERPLVIRRRKPEVVVAVGPTRPAKVSIYEDPTLRPGDAVMTADGVRVFAGSRSWPYGKSDFVPLARAQGLDRETVKVLAALDTLPRS